MLGNDARSFGLGARIVLVAIAVAALAGAIDSGAWAGDCITLRVDSPIRFPNGVVHPPGDLTLCDTMGITPVSRIHKTYIDGHPVAMLSSRKTRSEGGDKIEPVVMFTRDAEGRLELVGYVVPGRDGSTTYLLDESKKPVRRRSRDSGAIVATMTERSASHEEAVFVTLAARTPR